MTIFVYLFQEFIGFQRNSPHLSNNQKRYSNTSNKCPIISEIARKKTTEFKKCKKSSDGRQSSLNLLESVSPVASFKLRQRSKSDNILLKTNKNEKFKIIKSVEVKTTRSIAKESHYIIREATKDTAPTHNTSSTKRTSVVEKSTRRGKMIVCQKVNKTITKSVITDGSSQQNLYDKSKKINEIDKTENRFSPKLKPDKQHEEENNRQIVKQNHRKSIVKTSSDERKSIEKDDKNDIAFNWKRRTKKPQIENFDIDAFFIATKLRRGSYQSDAIMKELKEKDKSSSQRRQSNASRIKLDECISRNANRRRGESNEKDTTRRRRTNTLDMTLFETASYDVSNSSPAQEKSNKSRRTRKRSECRNPASDDPFAIKMRTFNSNTKSPRGAKPQMSTTTKEFDVKSTTKRREGKRSDSGSIMTSDPVTPNDSENSYDALTLASSNSRTRLQKHMDDATYQIGDNSGQNMDVIDLITGSDNIRHKKESISESHKSGTFSSNYSIEDSTNSKKLQRPTEVLNTEKHNCDKLKTSIEESILRKSKTNMLTKTKVSSTDTLQKSKTETMLPNICTANEKDSMRKINVPMFSVKKLEPLAIKSSVENESKLYSSTKNHQKGIKEYTEKNESRQAWNMFEIKSSENKIILENPKILPDIEDHTFRITKQPEIFSVAQARESEFTVDNDATSLLAKGKFLTPCGRRKNSVANWIDESAPGNLIAQIIQIAEQGQNDTHIQDNTISNESDSCEMTTESSFNTVLHELRGSSSTECTSEFYTEQALDETISNTSDCIVQFDSSSDSNFVSICSNNLQSKTDEIYSVSSTWSEAKVSDEGSIFTLQNYLVKTPPIFTPPNTVCSVITLTSKEFDSSENTRSKTTLFTNDKDNKSETSSDKSNISNNEENCASSLQSIVLIQPHNTPITSTESQNSVYKNDVVENVQDGDKVMQLNQNSYLLQVKERSQVSSHDYMDENRKRILKPDSNLISHDQSSQSGICEPEHSDHTNAIFSEIPADIIPEIRPKTSLSEVSYDNPTQFRSFTEPNILTNRTNEDPFANSVHSHSQNQRDKNLSVNELVTFPDKGEAFRTIEPDDRYNLEIKQLSCGESEQTLESRQKDVNDVTMQSLAIGKNGLEHPPKGDDDGGEQKLAASENMSINEIITEQITHKIEPKNMAPNEPLQNDPTSTKNRLSEDLSNPVNICICSPQEDDLTENVTSTVQASSTTPLSNVEKEGCCSKCWRYDKDVSWYMCSGKGFCWKILLAPILLVIGPFVWIICLFKINDKASECWGNCWKWDNTEYWFSCKGKGTGWIFLLIPIYILLGPLIIIFTMLTVFVLACCGDSVKKKSASTRNRNSMHRTVNAPSPVRIQQPSTRLYGNDPTLRVQAHDRSSRNLPPRKSNSRNAQSPRTF
ncbi:uncharacterized protein LOC144432432 [Styela clava]